MAKTKKSPARTSETPASTDSQAMPGDRPVHELRLGRVRCSVWRNETDLRPWYSVKITRLYKVDSEWKASPSLNRDDLLPAAKLCEEAAIWIFRQQQHNGTISDNTPATASGHDIPM